MRQGITQLALTRILVCVAVAVMLAAVAATRAAAQPTGTTRGTPGWTPPTAQAVRDAAIEWIDNRGVDAAVRERAMRIWQSLPETATATDRLAMLGTPFALADSRAERLVRFCASPREDTRLPDVAWLTEPDVEPLESANLRLLLGRWLVQNSLFDESLAQLGDLKPEQVVDPAALLFCQAVVHHRLLNKKEGLTAIDRLLDGESHCPRRYTALARLMREDLEGVKEETLDHIARRMEDIERRLDLGRAGPKVRQVEDGVIASLDKLIKDLEDQQQQSQGGGNNVQSSRPAERSQLMGGRGEGRVTAKRLGGKTGWGNLPPKQREEVLQEIGRLFPSHYRDVIEQYFRKMAAEEPAKD